jgi:hypothetical protein
MPTGFPDIPMTLQISCSVAFACDVKEARTSHKSKTEAGYVVLVTDKGRRKIRPQRKTTPAAYRAWRNGACCSSPLSQSEYSEVQRLQPSAPIFQPRKNLTAILFFLFRTGDGPAIVDVIGGDPAADLGNLFHGWNWNR